jgi:hypothetical protein
MKAKRDIISDTNDNIHIHISMLIRNNIIFHAQNRGNHQSTMYVIIQEITQTSAMLIRFLKNV